MMMHRGPFVLLLVFFSALPAMAQRQLFSLDRVSIPLTSDWTERRNDPLPPPSLLVSSAPKWKFSDLVTLENRETESVLKLAISDNALLGRDVGSLDTQMHTPKGMLHHLFYLFFPPPRTCLAQARSSLESARQAEVARHQKELARDKDSADKLRDVSIAQSCDFGPALTDFFAAQLSTRLFLSAAGESSGNLDTSFYIPPIEQIDFSGKTFLVMEADGQRFLDRAAMDVYTFPDSLQGARTYFFWAIGADAPFPFLFDPQRKSVPLIHVVYATLTTQSNPRLDFLEKLKSLRFE